MVTTMPKKYRLDEIAEAAKRLPDVCEVCGQKIDKDNSASVAHHMKPKHSPDPTRNPSNWWE